MPTLFLPTQWVRIKNLQNMAYKLSLDTAEHPVHFTAREKEILQLTLQEYTGIEIADKLYISPKTVNAHKTNLIRKIGAKNFIGVIAYAISYRIISINSNQQ